MVMAMKDKLRSVSKRRHYATDTRAIFLSRWQQNFCKIIALSSQEVATRATECATLSHNP